MILALVMPVALAMITLALLLNLWGLLRGPDMPDRVLALDTLYIDSIALLVLLGIQFDSQLYFESALVLALLGFLATVAFCRYLVRGRVIE
ncbi:multiple resistance and pH regulation protein F [Thiorhodococcus drewsii AZ1]|uniref:Multiple resistance and pH regulation protein F n=1 Tax=Thiorhodococcus drewsii AZ1 TaxID=765913 RepID=G2E2C7_9GAMM|nr:K+/H+ antiporter subunit F [Thiorhodococcus drewsii]EGV30843.1 multiple resistance and pH regulation protein F [Thiorhodococcus drewsii AZ1]